VSGRGTRQGFRNLYREDRIMNIWVLGALLGCCAQLALAQAPEAEDPNVRFIEARMPDYKVDYVDAYLCTAVPLPDEPLKVVGIEPLAKQEIAHHMLLFGAPYAPRCFPHT